MSHTGNVSRRLFVECSHTYLVGGTGGIRRATRNLANQRGFFDDVCTTMHPLVWGQTGFYEPDSLLSESPHPLFASYARLNDLLGHSLAAARRGLRNAFARDERKRSPHIRPRPPAHVELANLSEPPPSPRHRSNIRYHFNRLEQNRSRLTFSRPVQFQPSDIVVLVDSTWNSSKMLSQLFAARERVGIKVGVMLHDLFPLTLPEMCESRTVSGYRAWFSDTIPKVDFCVTNSEATQQSLHALLDRNPSFRTQPIPSASFRLGSDVGRPSDSAPHDDRRLGKLAGFLVLAVGTIEPRKNYKVILDAMERLWEDTAASLLLIGQPGWESEEILHRITRHPLLGQRLFHLPDASDAELNAAFRRADCMVCASWDEGFGLPLVEGLRHGLPVVASDIPVFREVGKASCRYFPANNAVALAEQLRAIATARRQGEPTRSVPDADLCISWEESAQQFRQSVVALADHAEKQ